ncbi:phosphatidate cytidylyltransferase [Pseudomonas sp. F1_0610]|uniref:phosphatidate cytidylyltransferase n=1 Tax=Pseudomonas sp. F1_0610 TaxID=3114284 RepID=UPI0039C18FA8
MLKQRILTALWLLPLALLGFFYLEGIFFALFIGAVITLGAWEWAALAGIKAQDVRVAYAALVAVLMSLLYLLPSLAKPIIYLATVWWIAAIVMVLTFPKSTVAWGGSLGSLLIGLLVLVPAWQGLVLLKQMPQANWLILAVMLMVWMADIGAYFVGKAIGKRKLAPQVSPGKSWEGAIGGLVISVAVVISYALWRDLAIASLPVMILGAAIVVAISIIGDLTESMFKRHSGIKDSSNLLPGHGGILDRVDSITSAVPVFVLLLVLAGWGA